MGKIYYLMGKSASGKDHIYEHLIQETALDLKPFVLYTTRPIRSGEQDGREYFFVDEKRLSELREAGKIIEERMYSTVQGPWYYFSEKQSSGVELLENLRTIPASAIFSSVKSSQSARNLRHISAYFGSVCFLSRSSARESRSPSSTSTYSGTIACSPKYAFNF